MAPREHNKSLVEHITARLDVFSTFRNSFTNDTYAFGVNVQLVVNVNQSNLL